MGASGHRPDFFKSGLRFFFVTTRVLGSAARAERGLALYFRRPYPGIGHLPLCNNAGTLHGAGTDKSRGVSLHLPVLPCSAPFHLSSPAATPHGLHLPPVTAYEVPHSHPTATFVVLSRHLATLFSSGWQD